LTVGGFYALIALGYTMVYGIVRLINFAHGDIYAFSAFIGLTVLSILGMTVQTSPLRAVGIAFGVSALLTGLLALLLFQVAYRKLLRASRLSILISALGASLAIEYGLRAGYGPGFLVYPLLFPRVGPALGPIQISWLQMILFGLSVLLMSGLYLLVYRTSLGRAMRALAINQDAARLMGINVDGVIAATFVLGAVLASAAGLMSGIYYTQINFLMGFLLGLKAFTAAVLGGIGNVLGAAVGGFLIGIIETLAAGYISSRWKDVVAFVILILVLVFRPRGILGERVVEKM